MKKLLLGLAFIAVANAQGVKDKDAEQDARIAMLEDTVFGKSFPKQAAAQPFGTDRELRDEMALATDPLPTGPQAIDRELSGDSLPPAPPASPTDVVAAPKKPAESGVAGPKLTEFQSLVKAYMEAGVLQGGASKQVSEAAKAEREVALNKVKDAYRKNPNASCKEFVAYVAGDAQVFPEKFGNIVKLFNLSPQLETKGDAGLIKGIKSGIGMREKDEKGSYKVTKRKLTAAEICENIEY